jgi:hypothetical protein
MRPLFTIHAGEYLVGSHIEATYRNARVWIPATDTGIDLLVSNSEITKTTSLQVKLSKDYLGNSLTIKSPVIKNRIKSVGWWKFDFEKMNNSSAKLWILVLYRFSYRDYDFVVIEPKELLSQYIDIGIKSRIIQSYVWVTEDNSCWETRGLNKSDQEAIALNNYNNQKRNLTKYLNNWSPLENILNIRK